MIAQSWNPLTVRTDSKAFARGTVPLRDVRFDTFKNTGDYVLKPSDPSRLVELVKTLHDCWLSPPTPPSKPRQKSDSLSLFIPDFYSRKNSFPRQKQSEPEICGRPVSLASNSTKACSSE